MTTTTTRMPWLRLPLIGEGSLVDESTPPPQPRWSRLLILIALLGLLAFCHGCHGGDHDDELSARHWWTVLTNRR